VRRLAIFVVRRRWWVIITAAIALPIAAVYGANVHDELAAGGFFDPNAESTVAEKAIVREFPLSSQSDFAIVVTAKSGNVDDPAVVEEGKRLTEELGKEAGVLNSSSYWTLQNLPQLRSRDLSQALIFATFEGGEDEKLHLAGEHSDDYNIDNAAVTTDVTGEAEVTRQISEQAEKDLARSEGLTAPLTFIALIIVFGSLVAAGLPLGVGIIAVLGTFVALKLFAQVTDVSVFSLNLTTGMGLGLAIDYSLFVVSRYREELGNGVSSPVAVGRSMQTAGRTVAFSAGTVAISLVVLAVFPMPYLRSFAYAGVAVVGLAAVASIIVLPAILTVLGTKVEMGRVFKVKETTDGGFWRHQADRVMRHPVPYAVVVSLILVLLAIPFFHVVVGLPDDRVGPDSMSSRAATDAIRDNFASREADALQLYVPNVDATSEEGEAQIDGYANALSKIPGVVRVDAATGFYGDVLGDGKRQHFGPEVLPAISERFEAQRGRTGTYLSVVPNVEPFSEEGEKLVHDVRGTSAPFEVHVAGLSAQLVDTKDAVVDRLPIVIGFIALATFVLLFMMTGSLLVPLKALLMNILSLTATFGAIVWIFQDGNLSDTLNFTPTGTIDVFTPILMFCIAFGLSMDYEVFLLSRIKEEYDLEHDNERAVAIGLAKTGRIVTAAALILTIVFIGIATSEVALLKAFGLGLALAVIVDAFLIRATLVPAFMRLAGRLNWWSPGWLRRWHLRFGIWENEPIALLDRQFETSL
jgi:putative drug exporter of the RND superfamily